MDREGLYGPYFFMGWKHTHSPSLARKRSFLCMSLPSLELSRVESPGRTDDCYTRRACWSTLLAQAFSCWSQLSCCTFKCSGKWCYVIMAFAPPLGGCPEDVDSPQTAHRKLDQKMQNHCVPKHQQADLTARLSLPSNI